MWVLASGLPGKSFSCLSYLWPFPLQVSVQNYNSVLTLSHLYRSSDALLVHENDAVHKICAKLMNIKQISFCDINQVLAHQLGSVFQPTYSGEGSFHYRRNPLGICAPVGYLWRSLMLWKPQSCSSLALPSTWRYTHISLTSEPSTEAEGAPNKSHCTMPGSLWGPPSHFRILQTNLPGTLQEAGSTSAKCPALKDVFSTGN